MLYRCLPWLLSLTVALLWPVLAGAAPVAVDAEWRQWSQQTLDDMFARPAVQLTRARAAVADARQRGDFHREWQATLEQYMAEYVLGEDHDAYSRLQIARGVEQARARGEQRVLFNLLVAQATSPEWSYRFEDAMKIMDEAERIAQALGDPLRAAFLASNRGVLHFMHGDTAQAIALVDQGLQAPLDDLARADMLMTRGILMRNEAIRYEDTRRSYMQLMQEALRLAPPERYPGFGQLALRRIAYVQLRSGQAEAAEQSARQALVLAQRIGVQRLFTLKTTLADALNAAGRPAEALRWLDEAGTPGSEVERLRFGLSRLASLVGIGQPQALQELERLRPTLKGFKDSPASMEAFHQIAARVYRQAGRYREADQEMQAWMSARSELDKRANEALRQELETRYEVRRREQENQALRASEAALSERRTLLSIGLVTSVVMLCLMGLLLWQQSRQKRRLAQLGAELSDRNAELQALHASRTRLLAAACHDLRQPAHALGLLAELAGMPDTPQAQAMRLEGIRRCSATLSDMLSNLMDLTQLEGERCEPRVAPLAIDDLMREVELQYGDPARRKGLVLDAPPTRLGVSSDRHLLRRILFNLVGNAVKYTATGRIEVRAQAEGDLVRLSVTDTGPGIPAERQAEAFKDHVRLDDSPHSEGLGIGLPIVRRAAGLLGHALQFDSVPGQGTAVTLSLPAASLGLAEAVALRPAQALPRGAAGRVALLEDDPVAREAMAALLSGWGFTVQASDGNECPADWLAGLDPWPDLLITDLHLARGLSLPHLQALRRSPRGAALPVLLLTGDLASELSSQAGALGAVLVHKPLMPRRLRARIDEALASHQPRAA